VDGDDAVVGLRIGRNTATGRRRHPAFFELAGIIDDADRLRIGMIGGDDLLNVSRSFVMVPDIVLRNSWSVVEPSC